MGWLIALGILAGLAMLPLGVSVRYDADGLLGRMIIGPVWLRVYPRSKNTATKKQSPKAGVKRQKKPEIARKEENEKGGSFTDFLPLLRTALDFLCDFRGKLRANRLELKLILAGGDPCDLAVNYGRAWAALGNLMPHVERLFVIKKRDLEVECDFTSDKTSVFLRLDLTVTLGRLLHLTLRYGSRVLREYMSIMKLRKGGAKI